jgi:hypothetical protein
MSNPNVNIVAKLTDPAALPTAGVATQTRPLNCDLQGNLLVRQRDLNKDTDESKIVRSAASGVAITSVNSLATVQDILVANAARAGVLIHNTDANNLFIKYGVSASLTDFSVRIPTNTGWVMPEPVYTGILTGIWDVDGAGAAKVTELTV